MGGLLNIGMRAVSANQTVLQVTGQNIANASTPGYSRQSVRLESASGQILTFGTIGSGVDVKSIERSNSDFISTQLQLTKSQNAADSQRLTKLERLESVFPTGTTGVGAAINDMLNAYSDVIAAPKDMTARYVVLSRSIEVAARIRSVQSQLSEMGDSVRSELRDKLDQTNGLIQNIALLNEQISRTLSGGKPANDLLDRRQQYVLELNDYVQTSQLNQEDGSLSLFVGNQAVVFGGLGATLGLTTDPLDSQINRIEMKRSGISVVLDDQVIGGGSIKGLMQFQQQDLEMARNLAGRLATTTAISLNTQHKLGLTMDNLAGSDIFQIADQVGASSSNPLASGQVGFVDPSQFKASSYLLRMDDMGGGGELIRQADGKSYSFTSLVQLGTQTIDGLNFQVSGAAAGDRMLFKPFASGGSDMEVLISSPRELAAGSPVELALGQSNTGTLGLMNLSVKAANPNLTDTISLDFKSVAGQIKYELKDSLGNVLLANQSYVPGQSIEYNGWALQMTGTPRQGDSATIQPANPSNINSNAGNARAMLSIADSPLIENGRLTDGYSNLIAQVGVRVQSVGFSADVSESIAANLSEQKSRLSDVNLDEEAARLIQFQQAYQASAKLLQVAQRIMDTILEQLR